MDRDNDVYQWTEEDKARWKAIRDRFTEMRKEWDKRGKEGELDNNYYEVDFVNKTYAAMWVNTKV